MLNLFILGWLLFLVAISIFARTKLSNTKLRVARHILPALAVFPLILIDVPGLINILPLFKQPLTVSGPTIVNLSSEPIEACILLDKTSPNFPQQEPGFIQGCGILGQTAPDGRRHSYATVATLLVPAHQNVPVPKPYAANEISVQARQKTQGNASLLLGLTLAIALYFGLRKNRTHFA